MDIYKYYNKPEELPRYYDKLNVVPRYLRQRIDAYAFDELNDTAMLNIAKNPKLAYQYALKKGERFPAGEPAIMKHSEYACRYARYVLRHRWPEAEAIIAQDPTDAIDYANQVIKGRFPAAEPLLATHANYAYTYARNLGIRFEKGEPRMLDRLHPNMMLSYIYNCVKGRLPGFEERSKYPERFYGYRHDYIDMLNNINKQLARDFERDYK